jgi:putative transposase
VAVSGKGSGRVSIAGLVCTKPGGRTRLFYRILVHRGRKGERKSLSEGDYATLLSAAHHQLGGPIVLVWDRLNTHISASMQTYIDEQPTG